MSNENLKESSNEKKKEYEKEEKCLWQGSNLRPSACEADVITTTLQRPTLITGQNYAINTSFVFKRPQESCKFSTSDTFDTFIVF